MRIVLVTSRYLTHFKRQVIDGLGNRLIGLAVVPTVPRQVGLWRHMRTLFWYAWPADVHRLALRAVVARVAPVAEPLFRPNPPWTVAALARQMRLPYIAASAIDDPRFCGWLDGLGPDLVVSMQSQRVGPEQLALARLGWLNLHHGKLPEYRGVFSIFWAMAHGERTVYITAHLMGPRLDQGPILVEEPLVVPDHATVDQMETLAWARSSEVLLRAVARLEQEPGVSLTTARSGGHYYTYPTRSDLQGAARAGLRLR